MKIDLNRFYEMKWIILFFIIGDTITTYFMITLGYGQEGNPFVANLLNKYGFISLIALKFYCLLFIYFTYPIIDANKNLWKFTKNFVTFIGIFACTNNISLIYLRKSIIEYILPFYF